MFGDWVWMSGKMIVMVLSNFEIQQRLVQLPDWQQKGEAIVKTFVFGDFVEAFDFMKKVAELAEQANHHPDWSNSYNKVHISLTSHSEGGLTQQDFDLAKKIDRESSSSYTAR